MLGKQNILIIDDDIHNIQLAINILKENKSYNIIFTTSGEEALKRVHEYKFDLILLDIIMEPMDGFEVCKILKSDSFTCDIPIIFLTAKDDEQSISKGFDLGAVDYITKPFFINELVARVKTHVNMKVYEDSLKDKIELQYQLMLEQNKMAAMGEMIGNIAHQWKQPLSVITTVSSGIKAAKEVGMPIDETKEIESLDSILINAQHLSKTIDDFKDFFKQKDRILFKIKDVIEKTINLIDSTLRHNGIKIKKNIKDIEFMGLDNELIQVFINIINNSQDILTKLNQKSKIINIIVYEENNEAIVKISDNAGGIKDEIMPHIFEAYFTTKQSSNGTGIGLNMSKKIVEDHFKGTIEAKNIACNDGLKGVEFTIKLPIFQY